MNDNPIPIRKPQLSFQTPAWECFATPVDCLRRISSANRSQPTANTNLDPRRSLPEQHPAKPLAATQPTTLF